MNDQVLLFTIFVLFAIYVLFRNRFEFFSENNDCATENANLKMLAKYLTLVLRKRDAEKELYRLAQGHAQVYHSPRLDLLDKQIYSLKKEIQKNPKTLNFFKLHLDLMI